ncbi:hypothetical protein GQR58_000552 [Nymphon striatum]|nr:hypothetical protein GQR58_000552 [Nymphon striatum]
MDQDEESATVIVSDKDNVFKSLQNQIDEDDEDDIDYYNDGSPEPKRKKENVDLFMDCEEEELTNSQLQSYNPEVEDYENNEDFEQHRVQQDWEDSQVQSEPHPILKVKIEKPRYDEDPDYSPVCDYSPRIVSAHSIKRKKATNPKKIFKGGEFPISNFQKNLHSSSVNRQNNQNLIITSGPMKSYNPGNSSNIMISQSLGDRSPYLSTLQDIYLYKCPLESL